MSIFPVEYPNTSKIIIIKYHKKNLKKMSKKPYHHMFKIILVGSSNVGKSNIILRFTQNKYISDHQMTFGV
jgi:GTPase SAR1 family protein